MTSQRDIIFVT